MSRHVVAPALLAIALFLLFPQREWWQLGIAAGLLSAAMNIYTER